MPSYLDEIYGLMPYGSDANPMNMEAMDMRPDDLRLADEIEAGRAKGPQPVVRPLPADENQVGSDANPMNMGLEASSDFSPEPVRVDKGNGSFIMMDPRDVPGATVKQGNVEYVRGGEPDMAGVNRPRAQGGRSPAGAPPAARGGPPPGVVPGAPPAPAGAGGELAVDAVSGAGGAPGAEPPSGPWSEYLEGPQRGRAAPKDTRASLMNEDQNSPVPEDLSQVYEREMARQASLTPEQRVAENAKREFERNQMGLDDMAAESARRRVEAQHNLDAMLAARKKSQAEIDQLKAKPGWFEGRSAGQKVALFASAIFSGMLAAFQGSSRNMAIESMQASIEQDAEERAQEFAQARQGMVDADEMFKLKEMVRLRGMEEAKGMILTRMAQYDKNGSMAAAGMAAVQDLDARQAEAEQKILEHNWKKELELRRITSEEAQKAASLQQSDIESRRAAGTARRGQDMQFAASQLDQQSGKNQADLENTKARTAAVEAELERHGRADVILDPGNTNWQGQATALGRPRDFEQRKDIQAGVTAYSKVRAQLKDLIAYTKAHGNEAGAGTEARKVIDQKRKLIAQTYAKIVDSVGAVSDKTIEAAEDVIPDTTGWIGGTLKNMKYTDEVYKSLVRNVDEGIEAMAGAGVEGYRQGTLSSQWTDFDQQMFSPPPTEEDLALERARGMSPGSFAGGKFKESAEEGAAERGEHPYAPVYDDSIEDPWEKARRGDE